LPRNPCRSHLCCSKRFRVAEHGSDTVSHIPLPGIITDLRPKYCKRRAINFARPDRRTRWCVLRQSPRHRSGFSFLAPSTACRETPFKQVALYPNTCSDQFCLSTPSHTISRSSRIERKTVLSAHRYAKILILSIISYHLVKVLLDCA
jgi:hypothetical protein